MNKDLENLTLIENYIKRTAKKDKALYYYRIYVDLSALLIIALLGVIFWKE